MTMSAQTARTLLSDQCLGIALKYIAAIHILDTVPKTQHALTQAVIKQDGLQGGMSEHHARARINHAAHVIHSAYMYSRTPQRTILHQGIAALEFLKGLDEQLTQSEFFATYLPELAEALVTDELLQAGKVLAQK